MGMQQLDNSFSFEVKPSWDIHGIGWSPDQGYSDQASSSDQEIAVKALSPATKALREVAAERGGNCQSITSSFYRNEYQAVLQIAILPGMNTNQAISQITSKDIQNLRFSPIDNQGQAGPTMTMATGIIPMDSLQPFTALRIIQLFIEHPNGTYVIRFNSYIPTPNDEASYDDPVFFAAPSKLALIQYVSLGGISLR